VLATVPSSPLSFWHDVKKNAATKKILAIAGRFFFRLYVFIIKVWMNETGLRILSFQITCQQEKSFISLNLAEEL
jgi:hypothetical protein